MKGRSVARMPAALALVLLLMAICLGAAGQLFIKIGLSGLGDRPPPLVVVLSLFRSGYVAGGFACYALSSVLYLLALSKLALSYAYPLVALSYVLVTILAWRVLHERIPAIRVLGLAVILAGVIIMALSFRDERPRERTSAPPGIHAEIAE